MDKPHTPLEALAAAVARAGSQSALARICGVSQPTVWKWLQSSKRMPAEYVLSAEAETGVSRHDLRPDIYPRNAGDTVSCFVAREAARSSRHVAHRTGSAA